MGKDSGNLMLPSVTLIRSGNAVGIPRYDDHHTPSTPHGSLLDVSRNAIVPSYHDSHNSHYITGARCGSPGHRTKKHGLDVNSDVDDEYSNLDGEHLYVAKDLRLSQFLMLMQVAFLSSDPSASSLVTGPRTAPL